MTPTNSGSKNGLVVWSICASVIGLGSLIWGAMSFVQKSKAEDELRTLGNLYQEVVDRPSLTGQTVSSLKEVAGDSTRGYSGMKLLEIAKLQATNMSTLVSGTADERKAAADAAAATEAAKAAVGTETALKTDNLVGLVTSLTDVVTKQKASLDQLTTELAAANNATQLALAERAEIQKLADEKVAFAETERAEGQKTADAYAIAQDAQTSDVTQQLIAKNEELLKSEQTNNQRIVELQQSLASVQTQLDEANAEKAKYRVPTNQILSTADGMITRTPGTDRVFINLGRGDQISPGMTFEVFDKLGAPSVTGSNPADDQLLKGKASIEVIRTEQGVSECAVRRLSPGATITEGDPILNVVYDKRVKFNFVVFGKFNLDYAGEANERDTEVVKRLISGWGGNVADEITTKTDFVVLGEEPEVPAYSQEELASEPEKAFQREQAEQALEAYTETRNAANALNIPIMNQTRFLYMIGYYNEAAR